MLVPTDLLPAQEGATERLLRDVLSLGIITQVDVQLAGDFVEMCGVKLSEVACHCRRHGASVSRVRC